MKGQSILIAAFAFALIIAIFAVINVEPVQVNFLFAKTSTPLILVILASTFLGGLTVGAFGLVRQYRLQKQLKQLEQQVADMQAGVWQPDGNGVEEQSQHPLLENESEALNNVDMLEQTDEDSRADAGLTTNNSERTQEKD
ncbi:lipopolysaccharide assembly LapA domain-containing protein [Paenibacillus yanchengensis]|uniref:Lipopolysaccharide assembly LapA domain-containing protein n=1 Tax=Paenibacillus yanchengensis TaxID=2035833 RepID=A0ABW4YGZ9_9BACL